MKLPLFDYSTCLCRHQFRTSQTADVLSPSRERDLLLAEILVTIVSPGHTSVAVVQHALHDETIDAEPRHAGRRGSSQIVRRPRLRRLLVFAHERGYHPINLALRLRETGDRVLARGG